MKHMKRRPKPFWKKYLKYIMRDCAGSSDVLGCVIFSKMAIIAAFPVAAISFAQDMAESMW